MQLQLDISFFSLENKQIQSSSIYTSWLDWAKEGRGQLLSCCPLTSTNCGKVVCGQSYLLPVAHHPTCDGIQGH